MKTLLLVDGTNIVVRYAHAMLPDVMSSTTRAPLTADDALRVCRTVERALFECADFVKASHAIVALDSPESWRRGIYPDYKCSRTAHTSPWSDRLGIVLGQAGWMVVRQPPYEADDILATLAKRLEAAGRRAAILSGDSDLLQTITASTSVVGFGRKQDNEPKFIVRTPGYVADKYGVAPSALRLWKALVGEPGDDIPGVRRVGPKKAATLLKFADYDLASLRGLLPTHSGTALSEFDLAIALVTLNTKVPLDPIEPARCILPPRPE